MLTIKTITDAMKGNDFWLDSMGREAKIVNRALTLGYVKRLSFTQVEWTEAGLARARRDLEK